MRGVISAKAEEVQKAVRETDTCTFSHQCVQSMEVYKARLDGAISSRERCPCLEGKCT